MKDHDALKVFPRFETDEEAERFVEIADLSEYDLSSFTQRRFAVEMKTDAVGTAVARDISMPMERDASSKY